jgi:hypothetical protein
MDGYLMFPIYGTLIIVIIYRISLISHMNKNQHGIGAGLGLTPSREGRGKWKLELEHHGFLN